MSAPRPFLIDTTVLVDVSRGRQPALSWLNQALAGPERACVSAVTIAEFFSGVVPPQRSAWQVFFARMTHWDVTTEIAVRAGTLRYELARRGRALALPDALIAATALVYDAVLVTENVRHFTEVGVSGISLAHGRDRPA